MSDAAATTVVDDAQDEGWSMPALAVMAALSAGAGIIHLAMIAPHSQDSAMDGLTMAASGWFQIAVAGALLVRPRRWVLIANIVANIAFIGVWAVSRTSGLPWGGHAGVAEAASVVDQLCVAFEVLMILGSALLLARPRIGADLRAPGVVIAAGIPVLAVIGLTTAVLASDAGTHDHGGGADHHGEMVESGEHDHGSGADHHGEETPTTVADDGHDHDHGEMVTTTTVADDGHDHDHGEMVTTTTLADDGHDHEH